MRPDFYKLVLHLNGLKKSNLVSEYAIGGGIAAYEYTSVPTKDVDVFIIINQPAGLVTLSPIYDYLRSAGYKWEGQWLVIEGFPTEFLVASDDLEKEAVLNAVIRKYRDAEVRIFRPEYIIAISLRLGRAKDIYRVLSLLESGKIDNKALGEIITKYGLENKLRKIRNEKS